MNKVVLLGVCLALLACTTSLALADEAGLNGKSEFSISAAWLHVAGSSFSLAIGDYGKFVTPNIEVKLGLATAHASGSNASAILPEVTYNFITPTTRNVVPYIGLGGYFIHGSGGGALFAGNGNDSGFDAEAGARLFLNGDYKTSKTAVFIEYRYLNKVFNDNVSTVLVGLTRII